MRSISACAARRSASSGGPNLACGLPPVEPGCVHVRVVRCFDSLHLTRQLVLAALQAIYAHCGVSCAHCRQDVDCRLPIHVGMILPFGCRMQGASPPGRRCPGGLEPLAARRQRRHAVLLALGTAPTRGSSPAWAKLDLLAIDGPASLPEGDDMSTRPATSPQPLDHPPDSGSNPAEEQAVQHAQPTSADVGRRRGGGHTE